MSLVGSLDVDQLHHQGLERLRHGLETLDPAQRQRVLAQAFC